MLKGLALFPLLDAGAPALRAMLALYLLLGMATAGVAFTTRSNPASMLRRQVNAWWLIFPVVSASLLVYPAGLGLLVLLIGVLALRELALHHAGPRWRLQLCCMLVLGLQLWLGYAHPRLAPWLLPLPILAQWLHFRWRPRADRLLLLMFLLLCYGVAFVVHIGSLPLTQELRFGWVFYLFALTALNDIAQFVSGKCFGKQKIARRISPNKTWQGLAGGVLLSMLASVLLGSYLQLASMPQLLGLALLLSVGGFWGDLLFSAAKRWLGVKDFSQLIPGHGGILDRADSLVVTAPLLYFTLLISSTAARYF